MRNALLVIILLTAAPARATEVSGPLKAADAFDHAIARGDATTVKAVLAPDVLIYEMGGQEASFDEYAAHHLKADMEFMAKVERTVVGRKLGVTGDSAWIATRRRMTGKYNDKPVDLFGTETLVLKREASGWKIVHVQWSSQQATKK